MLRTRFAPSPTGLLHVGNAYSALQCQAWAEQQHADLILRIEDIDHTRCRAEFATAMLDDLRWLGFDWQGEICYQSRRMQLYRNAIERLREMGVIYPCFCTRQQIAAEIARMASAPHAEDAVAAYPGLCRRLTATEQQQRMQQYPFAWRLDAAKAMQAAGEGLTWREASGETHPVMVDDDLVIGRKDIGVSYHLAVVVDDAAQAITHIIRGADLAASTAVQRLLQQLLGLPEPIYIHHPLLLDGGGERLAKRNHATTLSSLRRKGVQASALRAFLLTDSPPCWPFEGAAADASEAAILRMLGASGDDLP